jgi:anthranilate/para-aminobenzoate synthase component I
MRRIHRVAGSGGHSHQPARDRNPAPFAGYLDGGDWRITSASPEGFIRLRTTRLKRCRSMERVAGRPIRWPICSPATCYEPVKKTGPRT